MLVGFRALGFWGSRFRLGDLGLRVSNLRQPAVFLLNTLRSPWDALLAYLREVSAGSMGLCVCLVKGIQVTDGSEDRNLRFVSYFRCKSSPDTTRT